MIQFSGAIRVDFCAVDRNAPVAQWLWSVYSQGTDNLLPTSDSRASVHVPPLGWTDRRPEGRTHLLILHTSMRLHSSHTGYHWLEQVLADTKRLCDALPHNESPLCCAQSRTLSESDRRQSSVDVENTLQRSTCRCEIILSSEAGEKLQRELRQCLEILKFVFIW